MHRLIVLSLLLVSCDRQSITESYSGANFSCDCPKSWKIVTYHDDPGSGSVEFDFPGPGFATVIVFESENQGAFNSYTQIAAKKFPKIHESDNPDQKVTTIDTCKKTKLASLDALETVYSVLVAPDQRECTFTYVDLTSPDFVALVDIFDEGTPLGATTTAALERFITSVVPRRSESQVQERRATE